MGRVIDKNELVKHKKKALNALNGVFEAFIGSSNTKHHKKADLLAFWMENFSKYLLDEEKYDYYRIPKYRRGDVISLNFGFNVGSEHGGLHYAIVLDNDNRQSSPVITVVPLSSGTADKAYERDIYLGNELYDKLINKYNKFHELLSKDLQEAIKVRDALTKSISAVADEKDKNSFNELLEDYKKRVDILNVEKKTFEVYEKEINKLKDGSIALMEQITTVSKMRIYKPKNSRDLLHGIRFSDGAMDKINERLKELYIYSK